MTCTYYGGSTAEFVASILSDGVRTWDTIGGDNRKFIAGNESKAYLLYQNGTKVMVTELNMSAPLTGVYADGERQMPIIDVQFLATCKLLDLAAYQTALADNLSPIALDIAIKSAKKTMKPDYPLKRKGGTALTDFIEELVYFDLAPEKVIFPEHGEQYFTTPNYSVRSATEFDNPNLVAVASHGDSRPKARRPLSKAAYIDPEENPCALNLAYFEELGLIQQSRFTDLLALMTPPEAFQHAVREKLGYIVLDTATLDLPSGLMDD